MILTLLILWLAAWQGPLMTSVEQDHTRSAVCLHGYEFMEIQDTPAPEGYEPFYISHYGRHGSRSNWGDKDYRYVIESLEREQAQNNLTATGLQLLEETKAVLKAYDGMDGRLTDKGEREHKRLAERMYQRFEPVFTRGNHRIEAVGSQVQRSIISMTAFCISLNSKEPTLDFNFDTGAKMQRYIDCAGKVDETDMRAAIDSLCNLIPDETDTMMSRLFVRPERVDTATKATRLQDAVYWTAMVAEDFDLQCDVYRYLSRPATYKRMMKFTYDMSVPWIRIPGFYERRRPFVQVCMDDIIEKADQAIRQDTYCANLRFGHDIPLLTLVSAMGVSGVGETITLGEIADKWFGWENVPMASNMQMIFYKPAKQSAQDTSDETILVKVLYNERERTLSGLTPVSGPYYRWSDLKAMMTANIVHLTFCSVRITYNK